MICNQISWICVAFGTRVVIIIIYVCVVVERNEALHGRQRYIQNFLMHESIMRIQMSDCP